MTQKELVKLLNTTHTGGNIRRAHLMLLDSLGSDPQKQNLGHPTTEPSQSCEGLAVSTVYEAGRVTLVRDVRFTLGIRLQLGSSHFHEVA